MNCGDCCLGKQVGPWSIACELNSQYNAFTFSNCCFALRELVAIRDRYRKLLPILDDLIARRGEEEAQP